MSAQIPPTTIAPTPRNLICVLQSVSPNSTGFSIFGIFPEATSIGIAIHQLITPPANTKTAIFIPTMYPTATRAGDRLIPKKA